MAGRAPDHTTVNAQAAVDDAGSVFHHDRRLIALRRQLPPLVHGRYALLWPDHPSVYGYIRSHGAQLILVQCSFSREPLLLECAGLALAGAQVLSASWPAPDGVAALLDGKQLRLRPYEALTLQL